MAKHYTISAVFDGEDSWDEWVEWLTHPSHIEDGTTVKDLHDEEEV